MLKMKVRYLFTLLLFCFIQCAQAADIDKAAAQKAYENWCSAIGKAKGNASTMTKFYAPGAVLLATFSSQILTNRSGGLDSYFAKLTNNPDIQCKPQKLLTQVYNTVAVNTGFYNFTYTEKDGKTKTVKARFTFVYQLDPAKKELLISEHHSSVLPEG